MPKYIIDGVERCYGSFEVEAENETEARKEAISAFQEGLVELEVEESELDVLAVEEASD